MLPPSLYLKNISQRFLVPISDTLDFTLLFGKERAEVSPK